MNILAKMIQSVWDSTNNVIKVSSTNDDLASVNPVVSASYTRPDDTNAYVANDVISDSTSSPTNLTIATGLTSGSSCIVTSAKIRIDIASIPAGMGGFRIALFNAAPTAINDNSAFDLIDSDKAKLLDIIDIDTPVDLGSRLFGSTKNINSHIQLSDANLYLQLITKNAYTPSAQDVFTIYLGLMELRN